MTWLDDSSLVRGKSNLKSFSSWTNSELARATRSLWWKGGIWPEALIQELKPITFSSGTLVQYPKPKTFRLGTLDQPRAQNQFQKAIPKSNKACISPLGYNNVWCVDPKIIDYGPYKMFLKPKIKPGKPSTVVIFTHWDTFITDEWFGSQSRDVRNTSFLAPWTNTTVFMEKGPFVI